jgi:enamine deaminase RidA (YjgF/YER057c/UK114 family)
MALKLQMGQSVQVTELGRPADYQLFDSVPYKYASVVAPSALLFTAGACPLDLLGNVIGPGDHAAQATAALANLSAVLAMHGAEDQHLVRTTIYVVGDRDALVRVWDVIAAGLAPHRPPSTLVGVSVLGYRDQLVEIEGIATIPP